MATYSDELSELLRGLMVDRVGGDFVSERKIAALHKAVALAQEHMNYEVFSCSPNILQAQYSAMEDSGFYTFRFLLGCVVVHLEGNEPRAMRPMQFMKYLDDLACGDGESEYEDEP